MDVSIPDCSFKPYLDSSLSNAVTVPQKAPYSLCSEVVHYIENRVPLGTPSGLIF